MTSDCGVPGRLYLVHATGQHQEAFLGLGGWQPVEFFGLAGAAQHGLVVELVVVRLVRVAKVAKVAAAAAPTAAAVLHALLGRRHRRQQQNRHRQQRLHFPARSTVAVSSTSFGPPCSTGFLIVSDSPCRQKTWKEV